MENISVKETSYVTRDVVMKVMFSPAEGISHSANPGRPLRVPLERWGLLLASALVLRG